MLVLITGHAGFIGTRVWDTLVAGGHEVYGIDDLSRSTSVPREHPNSFVADIVDISKIAGLKQPFDWIIHLAGQVSVVAGESDPYRDFSTNCHGTFEVVQFARNCGASIIYASSNKVFGELQGVTSPIDDARPISPQTNYGVSKAAGGLYVADYSRGWTLHQSCIYGPSQRGEVDQGWIGWLANSIRDQREITCFGDGSQVRDLLHVADLVAVYEIIMDGGVPPGQYVVGGGEANAVTFREAVTMLGGSISAFGDWRPHDQKYFVSANSGLGVAGWNPTIDKARGLEEVRAGVGPVHHAQS